LSSIVDDINSEITKVKSSLTSSKITADIKSTLNKNLVTLQSWYDKLLAAGGLISQQDEADANAALIDAKRSQMDQAAASTQKKLLWIGIGTVGVIVAIIVIHKLRHK